MHDMSLQQKLGYPPDTSTSRFLGANMKTSFRKLIPVVAALGFAFAGSSAQAFTLTDGTNVIASDATTLDWNTTGSGVAKGIGPFNTPLTQGTQFEFLYQANLATVDGTHTPLFKGLDTTSNGLKDDGSYEFTIVAKLQEKVASISGNTATFTLAGSNPDNKVAIYYDTAANADTATGTGFDDGKLIALLTIVPDNSQSTFTQTSTTEGQGSTKLNARIVDAGDFIDPAYLQGVASMLFGIKYESNLNYPATNSDTTGFHIGGDSLFPDYTVQGNDIVFKVDGSNTFTNAVPEPGTMMLLGMGMMGLVGATRRRRAPKA
jgi:hypothetical protein